MLTNINWSGIGQSLVDIWSPAIFIISVVVPIVVIRKMIKRKAD